MNKLIALLFAWTALSACATPLPLEERIPHLTQKVDTDISVSIVDHRPFILNSDKEPWFEGITRGGFGIPLSLERPEPHKKQSFATYLSGMIQESIVDSGGKATVVKISMGTSARKSTDILAAKKKAAILGIMRMSRYDLGFSAEYNYDFQFIVIGLNGQVLADKSFKEFETNIPLSKDYTVFDMYTQIYAQKLSTILNDPEISAALLASTNR